MGMGKGAERPPGFDGGPPGFPGAGPPGFGPPGMFPMGRPPFDGPPPCGRPPFDAGPPPPGPGPCRPPFQGPPASSAVRAPFDAPPGQWHGGPRPPFDAASAGPSAAGDPTAWEVGSMVEGNFRESGKWQSAKIISKHPDGTFDVEYNGDYIEWKVPTARLRPLSA